MRKKEKIRLLELEIVNLNTKLANLRSENDNMINNTRELQMCLKSVLNELTEYDTQIKELKTANHILENKALMQKQQLELKETARRKGVGKISALTKKLNQLKYEKEGQNEMIKSFVKENRELKDLVKTNKDARIYLKGKNERE